MELSRDPDWTNAEESGTWSEKLTSTNLLPASGGTLDLYPCNF